MSEGFFSGFIFDEITEAGRRRLSPTSACREIGCCHLHDGRGPRSTGNLHLVGISSGVASRPNSWRSLLLDPRINC